MEHVLVRQKLQPARMGAYEVVFGWVWLEIIRSVNLCFDFGGLINKTNEI